MSRSKPGGAGLSVYAQRAELEICPGLNAVTKITKIAKFCKPATNFDEEMQITVEESP